MIRGRMTVNLLVGWLSGVGGGDDGAYLPLLLLLAHVFLCVGSYAAVVIRHVREFGR